MRFPTDGLVRSAALGLAAAGLLLACQPAIASVYWDFGSVGTGVAGWIEVDDTHSDYTPGGSLFVGDGILDFSFSDGNAVWTAHDFEGQSFPGHSSLTFGATTSPADIVHFELEPLDDAPPPAVPTGDELRIFGGSSVGRPNGQLSTTTEDIAGNVMFAEDGLFTVRPPDPITGIFWDFSSVGTDVTGWIEIDDTHAGYTPGGEMWVGDGILDFRFEDVNAVPPLMWTRIDWDGQSGVGDPDLKFGATTSPDDIASVELGPWEDAAPPATAMLDTLHIRGGMDEGLPNGQLYTKTEDISGVMRDAEDGRFAARAPDPIPEPTTLSLLALGGLGLLRRRRRK